jgi:heterotetrameric sarcosine oxidase gamma subunit
LIQKEDGSVPELVALTAFGRTDARRIRFGSLVLAEEVSIGLASLAVRRGAAPPHVEGTQLPEAGAWVEGSTISAFWTGPAQWMIEAKSRAQDDLEKDLRAAIPEAAVTEQTHGWVILEIRSEVGPRPIERAMEKLVNCDLARLAPGRATRTGIEHMNVFVIRRSPEILAVLGTRSMADSLWHALETAVARLG